MTKLYNLLKSYTLDDALELERQDPQFKALESLYCIIRDKEVFFGLILANSIVCYQLSSSGESYWREFSEKASEKFIGRIEKIQKRLHTYMEGQLSINIISFLKDFMHNSKGNKRLLEIKIKRLDKLNAFLDTFTMKIDYYLDNLLVLRDDLAIAMKQKKDAKTIVFAIKMIMYGMRIVGKEMKGQNIFIINIPIDSRLTKIFEKYKGNQTDIKKFYFDLSQKLKIPEIYLDAVLWVNYNELVK